MLSPARAPSAKDDTAAKARDQLERIAAQLGKALEGKEEQVALALTCALAQGHLLLEDVPGVGKTTLAEALAKVFQLRFARVQFTADLMPADIVGAQVFEAARSTFTFRPGPIFQELVLADELNRAPPRTQSALLEAMGQGQVTVDGVTHPLPRPFWVVATQNPTDLSGTYPLPDSQLDRFTMRLSLGHPEPQVEARLLAHRGAVRPVDALEPVSDPKALLGLQLKVAQMPLSEEVAGYIVALVQQTRSHPAIERGASTRASLALAAAARAWALWDARDFVVPSDVRAVLVPTLAHRLLLKGSVQGTYSRDEAAHLVDEIARRVPAPR
jgi:MoxR-like ATPase